MIKIAVSSVAALCGKHDFKSQKDALKELLYKNSDNPLPKNAKMTAVKTELYNSSFYQWYCGSRVVTSKMRIIARSIIVKSCKKYGVKFSRPFSYFCKQRGLYREKMNTDHAARLLKTKIFNIQRRIEKKYTHYRICGAIDGETDSHVIEIKTRSSPIAEPPIWEFIQLAWYCYILQKPGFLISFHNGEHKTNEITLEEATVMAEATLPELNKIFSSNDPATNICDSTA